MDDLDRIRAANPHARDLVRHLNHTVQGWHFLTLGDDFKAIDNDLVGYCSRCRHVLYYIEAAEAPADGKPTTVTRRQAEAQGAVVLLVEHADFAVTRARRVYPQLSVWRSPDELARYLTLLRTNHAETHHGRTGGQL